MDSVISSAASRAIRPEQLRARLTAFEERTLVLVMATEVFAHIAWRSGRRRAHACERKTLDVLLEAAGAFTVPGDAIVHAPGSGVFAVAFIVSTRAGMDLRQLTSIERRIAAEVRIDSVMGWAWVDASEDINELLRATVNEARMRRQRRELATFLHDVGTPLSSIHSSLTAVLDGVVDERTERRFLAAARDEAARVGRIVRDFLIVESRDELICDLGAVLAVAVAAVEPLARERATRIDVANDSSPSVVAIDPDHAVAIFVALLENAIKHGVEGGHVVARMQCQTHACEVRIEDDGPGVAPAARERIFEYGARAGGASGNGIGLARARSLLERRGGTLGIGQSDLGGACFTLRLPLSAAPAAAIGGEEPRGPMRSPAGDI